MLRRVVFDLFLVLIISVLILSSCGSQPSSPGAGQPAAAPIGNAANGQKLFSEPLIASAGAPGCAACHSVEAGKTIVGPSLAGIAVEAEKIVQEADYKGAAKTGVAFLRESIVAPNAYVPQGFKPDIMPKTFNRLSGQELDDLVTYLTTLK